MQKIKQLLPHAIAVGGVGAFATWLSIMLQMSAWALYLAMVGYLLHGGEIKRGIKMYLSLLAGILIAMLITYLGGKFGNQLIIPLIIFFITGSLTFLEGFDKLNDIPGYYIGMITFFASGKPVVFSSFYQLLLPALMGVFFAWLSVSLRTRFLKPITANPEKSV